MKYHGKQVEVLGTKEVFGETVAWIRVLEDDSFQQVSMKELTSDELAFSLPYVRHLAIAAKIKDEVSKKTILAPYESSLIPLPHQILVLEKVMKSAQNRFLLADEVGMGKTIEAGLILKELKLRGDIKRVLAIIPKSAMLQWQSELKEHFNEMFHVYDSELITSLSRTFSNINADQEFNFWEQHNQIIVSTDALKPLEKRQGWSQEKIDEYNKFRMEAVLSANFDLVLIDEAHKMGGASQTVSRYVLAQELCNSVPNVLLLTATPHRGKADHFRRILQLLDPDAFMGEGLPSLSELEPYVIRTEKRLAVDYDGNKLFNQRVTSKFVVELAEASHARQIALYESLTDYVRRGFNSAKSSGNTAKGLIMILFQRLVSSSSAAILSAMEGRLQRLRAGDGDDDIDDYQDEVDSMDSEDSEIDYSDILYSPNVPLEDEEAILSQLIQEAKSCMLHEVDAKAESLTHKIKSLSEASGDSNLKCLVFTEFRSTQRMLKKHFEKSGYECVEIHGGQDLDQRKAALSRFSKESQILVATDAAGESLNMQFCHIVFNYDLPWNPMMIEQRIGRVDRIGQKHPVQAYNMLTNNSVDQRVYEVIEEKLSNILENLGIDKSRDVLDSTLDMKNVNNLYLQSLLDPSKFDFAGDKWLHEIKGKLRHFQSTESILPEVEEDEIDKKKAAEIHYSPLPVWLERLITQHTLMQGGSVQTTTNNFREIHLNGEKKVIAFNPEESINHPEVQHITLQHNWVKRILSAMGDFSSASGIPILKSTSDDVNGFWSVWEVSATQLNESHKVIQPVFISDNNKLFPVYAADIWERLLEDSSGFEVIGLEPVHEDVERNSTIEGNLQIVFEKQAEMLRQKVDRKKENRLRSYDFQKQRIERIGIDNIRIAKLKNLEKDYADWKRELQMESQIVPNIKCLINLRISGQ
jgi:SNF2 family DNA or RNA helicase